MANYKTKHKILENLFEHYKIGEKNTGRGKTITDLGRSLTLLELSQKIGISNEKIDDVCNILKNDGYLTCLIKDIETKNHSYIITEQGKKAFTDKEFLNNVWYRNRDFWFKTIPIIITAGTLIWTITINNNLKKKVSDQEIKIINLENALKKLIK